MHITTDEVRRGATLFPRHPAVWVVAAALIAVILVRRPPPDTSSAGVSAPATRPVSPVVDRTVRAQRYAWLSRRGRAAYEPLAERVAAPDGFVRIKLPDGSYGDWLRHLPCLPTNAAVLDGRGKPARPADDPAIAAVIDLAPSNRGLLHAANMAIRLRAEYMWSAGRMDDLHLSFTSGEPCPWSRFVGAERPSVQGKIVTWHSPRNAKTDQSRTAFTAYLESLMPYASIISLEHDTDPAQGEVAAGDVFVLMGRAPHAVVVLDVAMSPTGERRVLLGEGFTPPQSFHVIRQTDGTPWFRLDKSAAVSIPTWSVPLPWKTWRRWPTLSDEASRGG